MQPLRPRRKKTTRRRVWILNPNLKTDACIYIIQAEPTAAKLAKRLGVSVSTVSRLIKELRREKRDIISVRTAAGWKYQFRPMDPEEVLRHPSSTFVVPKSECHPPSGKAEDAIYDRD